MLPEDLSIGEWFSDLSLTPLQHRLIRRLFEEKPHQFHSWLLGAANRMRNSGFSADQTFRVLMERADFHKSRNVASGEIRKAIQKAFGGSGVLERPAERRSDFSKLPTKAKLRSVMDSADWPQRYGVEELLKDAPQFSTKLCQQTSADLLGYLFGRHRRSGGPRFLCVGRYWAQGRGYESETLPWSEDTGWTIPERANFVVPNLANAQSGITQEGRPSNRSKDMFPDRDYLVLESDMGQGTDDIQAALIRFTGKVMKRRPVMVVRSGSKSLHSWWSMTRLDETLVTRFVDEMAGLFDPAAKQRNQFFRMPNGKRLDSETNPGAIQRVIFFDYEALADGIPRLFS